MKSRNVRLTLTESQANWLYTFLNNLPPHFACVPACAQIQNQILERSTGRDEIAARKYIRKLQRSGPVIQLPGAV